MHDGSLLFSKMASDSESGTEFEVDKVLQKRKSNKGLIEYLIRWKGYGPNEDSWEPAKNLTSSKRLLDAFNRNESKQSGRRKSRSSSRSRSRSRSRGRARSTSKGRKSPGRPKASPGRTPKSEPTRRSVRSVVQNEVKVEPKIPVQILKPDETDSNTNRSVIRERYTEKVTTTTTTLSSAASSVASSESTARNKKKLSEYLSLTRSDYPVMIIFLCITIITLSFVVEKYVNCEEVWNRITTGVQNVASKFKWSK